YRGEYAHVFIWSTASVNAARSPFLAASRSCPTMTLRLMREGRVTGPASALLDGQLVLLAMVGAHRLDRDLSPEQTLHVLEPLALARLQVMGDLGVNANHHVAAGALAVLRLDLAEDLGGQG